MSETLEFKAELKQLLHLITHSLYSDREIFLRELISQRVRRDQQGPVRRPRQRRQARRQHRLEDQAHARRDRRTRSPSPTTASACRAQEVIENLGTVAQSGTQGVPRSREARRQDRRSAGADRPVRRRLLLRVHGRGQGDGRHAPGRRAAADGTRWESDGQGTFTVEPAEKPTRGTDVILHLKDDAKEFLDPWRLRAARPQVLRLPRASRRHGRGEGEGRQEGDDRGDAQHAARRSGCATRAR